MNSDKFKALLNELEGNSVETLKEKNARYSQNGDCLHNFRSGAQLTRKTPAQTCWGYMSKHLTALLDKVEANDFSDREDFLEKCQDTINYIRFLWCIGNDERDKTASHIQVNDKSQPLKYYREIRVYSKHNGILYASCTIDKCCDVEVFKDFFVLHGLNDDHTQFSTEYSFDNFFCVIAEKFNDELKHQIIDKESN